MKKVLLTITLSLIFIGCLVGQDLTNIAKAKPFTMSGGFSGNTSMYNSWGMNSRQDPYYWQIAANINFNFYGIVNMPFSAYFAKENKRYQQPSFMIYGISPRYKSVTLHLGYRNMTFSNYSLAGLTFFGAGVEYKPSDSWISASAMYGRFFKAVTADSAKKHFQDPSYERWGGGFSVTVRGNNKELTLIMFKAADKIGSIPDPPASTKITPSENFIIGVATKTQIIRQLAVSLDYTLSAFTSDIRTPKKAFQQFTYLNNLGSLFTPRYSTSFSKALETSVNYQGVSFSAGIAYKRIDPGYASLGSTFIENDFEDILVTLSKSFAQNKISISGNLGEQFNNLSNEKQTENKRVIGSVNFAWNINQSLNVNTTYSNYTSSTLPTSINFTDSIKYFQINKNASFNINYNEGSETIKHGVSLMVALQNASSLNRSATMKLTTNNDMVNSNLSYQISWPKNGFATSLSMQSSWFINALGTTKNFGPNLSANKDVLKSKVRLTISYGFNITQLADNKSSSTHIVRFNCDYQVGKRQTLRFQSNYMQRKDALNTGSLSPKEFQSNLVYQYTF